MNKDYNKLRLIFLLTYRLDLCYVRIVAKSLFDIVNTRRLTVGISMAGGGNETDGPIIT